MRARGFATPAAACAAHTSVKVSIAWALGLILAGSIVGCDSGSGTPRPRRDTGTNTVEPEDDAGSGQQTGHDAGGGGLMMVDDENCGTEYDDNGNGLVNEGCPCATGDWAWCWTGPPGRLDQGICRRGQQLCQDLGEFSTWGPCEGAVLPQEDIPNNGIDEDCDGVDSGSNTSCGELEDCSDGRDNNCDGRVDCADPQCADRTDCRSACDEAEYDCNDGRDNDCDGPIDCRDSDCAAAPECRTVTEPPPVSGCQADPPYFIEVFCGDGRDNDCDGAIDCADSDCRRPGQCGCDSTETACSDGVDNDCEGGTDCSDTDCRRCVAGTVRWCDDPVRCHWGRQTCQPDGTWGYCSETTSRPTGCTTSSAIYNRDCCVMAGECCENYIPGGIGDRTSVGNCPSQELCSGR